MLYITKYLTDNDIRQWSKWPTNPSVMEIYRKRLPKYCHVHAICLHRFFTLQFYLVLIYFVFFKTKDIDYDIFHMVGKKQAETFIAIIGS